MLCIGMTGWCYDIVFSLTGPNVVNSISIIDNQLSLSLAVFRGTLQQQVVPWS